MKGGLTNVRLIFIKTLNEIKVLYCLKITTRKAMIHRNIGSIDTFDIAKCLKIPLLNPFLYSWNKYLIHRHFFSRIDLKFLS